MLNSEKIKPITLAVIELHLSEGISQSVNLLNKVLKIIHSNLMQRFRVDLKTFLGLAMPNQCYNAVTKFLAGL